MKRPKRNVSILFTLILLSLFMSSALAAPLTYSQDKPTPINDRAGFRRPTIEVLQLEGQLRGDVETRLSLGLKADVAYVQRLRGSIEDVGSAKFNVPLTQAEYDELQERWDFASATRQTLMPYVRALPIFAGAYYDHSANGDLIILLTAIDADTKDNITALAPQGRDTHLEIVDYTQRELRQAVKAVWDVWARAGGPEIYTVAVDVPANAIRIEVDVSNLQTAQKLSRELATTIGVPLFAVVGEKSIATVCASRDNCHTPMKAGIMIRKGYTGGSPCTMGFLVNAGSDVQFVTAGHCSYTGSNHWYHQGYGYIGSEQANLYGDGGIDAMRVQMSNSQASESLYDSAAWINATDWPTTGLWVCASLSMSNSWSCGTVADNYTSWNDNKCIGCIIYGGDTTHLLIGGDSGSPLVAGNLPYTAIGIMNTSSGKFAIMNDVLIQWWGWWIH